MSSIAEVFDLFIEVVLKSYRHRKSEITLSFEDCYKFFRLFGLDEIQPSTLNKLATSLQWKLIYPNFINRDFILKYKDTLPENSDKDLIKSLNHLIDILKIRKREDEHYRAFVRDVEKILSE
jgi:hypothetical protein